MNEKQQRIFTSASEMGKCTTNSEKPPLAATIPGYRNTIRDSYRLENGKEVAIFYPQAIRSLDEENKVIAKE